MSDSDLEIKRITPMKPVKKPPNSPTVDLLKAQEKKVTTKAMIHEALTELKTRKGVSIQAIKKYMEEKYCVETDKVKYLIKKTLKTGVEDGSILQLKGIGASGSFKLAAVKEKAKNKPKAKKEKAKKEKSTKEKSTKETSTKERSTENPMKRKKENVAKEKAKVDKKPVKKLKIDVKDKEKTEKPKEKKAESKEKKLQKAKTGTPKKKAMIKRKSVGSIIRPPKMKPKSKA